MLRHPEDPETTLPESPASPLRIVPAETLGGERVVDRQGNPLGAIEDLVIDVPEGRIAYAVMSGHAAERRAVPWNALSRDESRRCFVLDEEVAGS